MIKTINVKEYIKYNKFPDLIERAYTYYLEIRNEWLSIFSDTLKSILPPSLSFDEWKLKVVTSSDIIAFFTQSGPYRYGNLPCI